MRENLAVILFSFCVGVMGFWALQARTGTRTVSDSAPPPAGDVQPSVPPLKIQYKTWKWADVEDPDYAKLASNLKVVECPKTTIDDLLRARINREYRLLMLTNPMSKYWETLEERKEREKELADLLQKKEKLLQSLGLPSDKDHHSPGKSAAPFSPDKMEQIAKITQKYPQKLLGVGSTEDEYQEAYDNRRARLQYLAQYLTPDELTKYRLTQDSNVAVVAKILRVINATPAEINNAAFAFDFTPASINNGSFTPEAAQALQAGLGDQRYAELLAAFTPANYQFSNFIIRTDVTPDEVAQLQQLRQQNLDRDSMQMAVTQLLGPQLARQYFFTVHNH